MRSLRSASLPSCVRGCASPSARMPARAGDAPSALDLAPLAGQLDGEGRDRHVRRQLGAGADRLADQRLAAGLGAAGAVAAHDVRASPGLPDARRRAAGEHGAAAAGGELGRDAAAAAAAEQVQDAGRAGRCRSAGRARAAARGWP